VPANLGEVFMNIFSIDDNNLRAYMILCTYMRWQLEEEEMRSIRK